MKKSPTKHFAVLDLETDPFAPGRMEIEPFCAGYADESGSATWWGEPCVKELIARLKREAKRRPGLIIYAHNGGNFDFHFMLPYLPVAQCKFLCIGKRIVQIKTPFGFELRDSFAIIPKALAAYQKTPFDYRKMERPVREKHKAEIISYLKDDLHDLFGMIEGFIARFPLELTLASSSYKIMQEKFDAGIERTEAGHDQMMRPFYFAGRVQFWELGQIKGRVDVLDINSAFPWAMTFAHAHGGKYRRSVKLPNKNPGPCFIIVECWSDGELPVRNPKGGVDFPTGRHTFHVTGWEYVAALKLGKIKQPKIHEVLIPKETKNFSKFVNYFYDGKLAAKKRGDKEEEFFFKIVLNSGYGRLALNVKKYSEVCVTTLYDTPDEIDGKTGKERAANAKLADWSVSWDDERRGLTFHQRKSYREGVDKFINVATAASITGKVRAFLMESKALCGGALYCDTDSLVVRNFSELRMGEKLGEWKHEGHCLGTKPFVSDKNPGNCFYIGGKKLYAAFITKPDGSQEAKLASKGVRLSPAQLVSVALGDEEDHINQAPTYSVFSPPRQVKRTIRRADNRNLKNK